MPNFKQKYEFEFIKLDSMTGQISELKAPSTFGRAANLTSHQVTAGHSESNLEKDGDKPTLDVGKETHLNLVDNSLVPKIGQVSY